MYSLQKNYDKIKQGVAETAMACLRNPEDIKVLVVSKTHGADVVLQAMNAGIHLFAENYAQEFRDKYKDLLPHLDDLETKPEFHFIGHLQTNKVKYVVPHVTAIHTVDSSGLAAEIERQAARYGKHIDILLQINTSNQASKSGIEPEETNGLAQEVLKNIHLNLVGLMTIGTFSDDEKVIRTEFSMLRNCLNELNQSLGLNLSQLSMGMSHDYKIAIEEQATMLRIGSAILGSRS